MPDAEPATNLNFLRTITKQVGNRLGNVLDFHLRPIATKLEENQHLLGQVHALLNEKEGSSRATPEPGTLSFICNICSQANTRRVQEFHREIPSCSGCGSTPRFRAIVSVLTTELFGESMLLDQVPLTPHLSGIGLTDWEGYSTRLETRFHYRNTYYDQEPKLDIVAPDPDLIGSADFLIATDVFEHVPPPVSVGFRNARRLLKPGGVLIMSVPYGTGDQTIEHYPDLHDFEILEEKGRSLLRNRTKDGVIQEFEDPVFHGGPGLNLEMRRFSKSSLRAELRAAGFTQITFYPANDLAHGAFWPENQSLPLAAKSTAPIQVSQAQPLT
ncbi:MAG: methyltransferase domain-containing protein [Actinomycetota bacterium]